MTDPFDLAPEPVRDGDASAPGADLPGAPGAGFGDDAAMLRAWERARDLERPWRELELLAAASGARSAELAGLPIGERDRRLLRLREARFGRRLDVVATCPACAAPLELELDTQVLREPAERAAREPDGAARTLRIGPLTATFRLPTSADIAAAARADDPEAALLARCLVAARRGDVPVAAEDLPADARDALAAAMAELDPLAEIALGLRCPACGHAWSAPLDPAAILLDDVDAWADRVMHDVSELARAFGWREPDVLALGPVRRQRYLELATA